LKHRALLLYFLVLEEIEARKEKKKKDEERKIIKLPISYLSSKTDCIQYKQNGSYPITKVIIRQGGTNNSSRGDH